MACFANVTNVYPVMHVVRTTPPTVLVSNPYLNNMRRTHIVCDNHVGISTHFVIIFLVFMIYHKVSWQFEKNVYV